MDIKVGDKVRYTGPSKKDLTRGKVYEVVEGQDWWLAVTDDVGDYNAIWHIQCEPVTDTPQEPDYNNGEWHGWNGGKCPVHPKTRGDMTYADGTVYENAPFGIYKWDEPLLFRVTKPYVEPKKPREVWLLIEDEYITDATFDGTDALKHEYVRAVLDD